MELTVTYGSGWLPCIIDDLKKNAQFSARPLLSHGAHPVEKTSTSGHRYAEFWMLVPDKWFLVAHVTKKKVEKVLYNKTTTFRCMNLAS